MSLSLGIDIGTSGVRTAVLDENGTVLSQAQADHLPQDLRRIDAFMWWRAVQICVANQVSALEALGRSGEEIARIATDGTSGTIVLTDENLDPVSRALMYNSAGFESEASAIAHHAPLDHITRGTGSALARVMRLVSEDHEKKARFVLHQADYIAAKLVNRGGRSDYNNALKTGFDPEAEQWPGWIEHVIDRNLLPDVYPPGTLLGTISCEVASSLGISKDAIVHAGTTDSIAAFLACAPLKAGVAVTSLGSTLAVKLLCHNRVDDPAIGLYSHRLGEVWLAGGASNTGGAVLASFFSRDELDQLSARIDPHTPSGLDFYPLTQPGERFPINDPDKQPRLEPRPQSNVLFLQGMLEGIALIEEQCYREIAARGGAYPDVLFTAGGGASNPVFQKIRSRTLGLELKNAKYTDAAIGAAQLTRLTS